MIRPFLPLLAVLAGPAMAQTAAPVPEVFRIAGPALMEPDYFFKDLERSIIARQVRRHLTRTTEQSPEEIVRQLAALSHDEMLALWLDTVFLGRDCHGIEAALGAFFETTPQDATLKQAVTLMALVRGPEPTLEDPDRLASIYAYLLEQIVRMDGVTFDEARAMIDAGPAEINSSAKCDP